MFDAATFGLKGLGLFISKSSFCQSCVLKYLTSKEIGTHNISVLLSDHYGSLMALHIFSLNLVLSHN